MKQIDVTIKGISELLMHRFPLEPVPGLEKMPPAEQAEVAAYRDPDGVLYIPSEAITGSINAAAVYSKGKGRASLQKVAAAAIFISPPRCSLGVTEYEVDSRAVVVPATKGRIVRHRPRLDQWSVSFVLEYDEMLLSEVQVRKILDDAGSLVGVLDFRPQTKGRFGRFMVTSFKRS